MSNAIEFNPPGSPFRLSLDPIDADEHAGSFKANVSLIILHSSGEEEFFSYRARDIWVLYSEFDAFLDRLSVVVKNQPARADLRDMSDYFGIAIEYDGECHRCTLRVCESVAGDETTLNSSSRFDQQLSSQLLESFRDFPKWW